MRRAIETGVLELGTDAAYRSVAGMASQWAILLIGARGSIDESFGLIHVGFASILNSIAKVERAFTTNLATIIEG